MAILTRDQLATYGINVVIAVFGILIVFQMEKRAVPSPYRRCMSAFGRGFNAMPSAVIGRE